MRRRKISSFPFRSLVSVKKWKKKCKCWGKKNLLSWACTAACRGWPWSPVTVVVWASPVRSTVIIHWKGIWQYMQVLLAKNNPSWQLYLSFFSVTLPFPFLCCCSVRLARAMVCCETTCQPAAWTVLPASTTRTRLHWFRKSLCAQFFVLQKIWRDHSLEKYTEL